MPAIVKIMINGTRVVYRPVGETSGICCKAEDTEGNEQAEPSPKQRPAALTAHSFTYASFLRRKNDCPILKTSFVFHTFFNLLFNIGCVSGTEEEVKVDRRVVFQHLF